jgi:hypothetical protein
VYVTRTSMPLMVSFLSQMGGVDKSTPTRELASTSAFVHGGLAGLDEEQPTVIGWPQAGHRNNQEPSPPIVVSTQLRREITPLKHPAAVPIKRLVRRAAQRYPSPVSVRLGAHERS